VRPRLVLVTDPVFGDDVIVRCVEAVADALPPGALCVQLRDKHRATPSLRLMGNRLRAATRRDGGHLGGDGGSVGEARKAVGRRTWISVAAHTDDDVRRALAEGADAALVSPIFPTRSPAVGPTTEPKRPRGLGALRSARAIAGPRLALFALGGVTLERARPCAASGADGVAVLRALLASPAPAALARALHDTLAPRW
jgi:thiamine-phosphate pyrophosphorylase